MEEDRHRVTTVVRFTGHSIFGTCRLVGRLQDNKVPSNFNNFIAILSRVLSPTERGVRDSPILKGTV